MNHFTYDISDQNPIADVYFTEDVLAYDIETTGFSARYQSVYLIGCLVRKKEADAYTLHQWLAKDDVEEKEILEAFFEMANAYPTHLTFNGLRFDEPFLCERAKHYGLDCAKAPLQHLDLYIESKKYKKLLSLVSCRQKSIETFLGVSREDRFSGGELISVYKDFQVHPEHVEARALLLQHNYDDVKGLLAILPIVSYASIDTLTITRADVKQEHTVLREGEKDELLISCSTNLLLPAPFRISSEYGYFIFDGANIRGCLPLYHETLRLYLPDYKNYVYLPEEDTCIPKELATSIPKERKQRATADLCFVKKSGLFLPLPNHSSIPENVHLFYQNRKDKQAYLLFEKDAITAEFLQQYLDAILKQKKAV